ncbi:ribonuclease H-like domain-containing protein [Tanacetum coccineum]
MVISSPCLTDIKNWLVQKQTAFVKDFSNLFTTDSLLKPIWFSTHHASHAPCYSNEALAIPEQTTTGKEISNPFMAEKTEGNSDFHEIVDFLASSSIHHALTINATVDSKAVVVTEASIRNYDLKVLVEHFNPVEDNTEEEQLRASLKIVPDEEEDIDYEFLGMRYPIVNWESAFYHTDRYGVPHDYYKVFRANVSSRYIKTFTEMVSRFDRLDFIELHIHILALEDGTEIHMLAERRYPLIRETLERMIELRLTAESEGEAVFNLLRFIQKQIDEFGGQDGNIKNWLVQKQTTFGKDFLNSFTNDSLLKTIWFLTHHASHAPCYSNEALAIPEQTTTGKEISNPFMAGEDCWVLEDFTTYCCWFNIGAASEDLVLLRKIEENRLMFNQCFIIVALDLSKVTNPLQAKGSRSIQKMTEQDSPPPTITAMKIPIIKKGEYDIWSMRMRQYICHTDHNLWDIIVDGDLQEEAAPAGEQSGPPAPKTAKQLTAKRNQERVKSILLLAIPDEYLLKFHNVPDAKSLWAAIKSRFGGNDESKKMQRNVLKHQFENFTTAPNESLDKAYDRFQKLISQLEVHAAPVSKEDINQKFLRSLPPSWRYTRTRFLKTKNEAFEKFEILSRKIQNQLGITHNFSAPCTPQSNGVVERKNRTLQEMCRTMLNEQSIPQKFWIFSMKVKEIKITSYQHWLMMMLVFNKHTMKVKESLNMTFDESPSSTKLSPLVDDDVGEEEAIKKNAKIVNINNKKDESIEVYKIVNIKESTNHPPDQVIGNLNQRTLRSQAQNHSNFFCFISIIELKDVKEALKDES